MFLPDLAQHSQKNSLNLFAISNFSDMTVLLCTNSLGKHVSVTPFFISYFLSVTPFIIILFNIFHVDLISLLCFSNSIL